MAKIEVEVPDGEYCWRGSDNCHFQSKIFGKPMCGIYRKPLKALDYEPFNTLKCNACLLACIGVK